MARPEDSGAVAYTPLAAPENAHNQAPGESALAKKQSSLSARLGIVGILLLGLGSLMLVLFVLPLAWLWTESMAAAAGREPSSTWIAVVKAGWTTRVVTICTAILRTVVTTQASVATAMFAGIILALPWWTGHSIPSRELSVGARLTCCGSQVCPFEEPGSQP
jgi:small-conductance mechanosensitive channel